MDEQVMGDGGRGLGDEGPMGESVSTSSYNTIFQSEHPSPRHPERSRRIPLPDADGLSTSETPGISGEILRQAQDDDERVPSAERSAASTADPDQSDAPSPAQSAVETLRQAITEVYPGVDQSMLPGETIAELLTALPGALEALRQSRRTWQPDPVPTGPTSRSALIDVEGLSPEAKIRAGLR